MSNSISKVSNFAKSILIKAQEKYESAISTVDMSTPNLYKAVIPKFLYKPPFGYPRFLDIPEVRRLASTPYVEMIISTIVDEIAAITWEMVAKEKENANNPEVKSKIEETTDFLNNPNINKENFQEQIRKIVRDILTLDSGVWVKVFDISGRFKELYVRDGGTFTLNPDKFGTFNHRAEIIPYGYYGFDGRLSYTTEQTNFLASTGAYFQYGWLTGARPMPFGKREIIYIMRNPRPDSIYGRSAVEICLDVVQMLIYGVDFNLEYFTDNNIPKGVYELMGAKGDDVAKFKASWREATRKQNEVGDYRKRWHHMPISNVEGKFTRLQFSAEELQLITQQQWFSKLIMACFGMTASELGFTESSNRATEIIQSKVFKRKAIIPILNILEHHINSEIIPEFFMDKAKTLDEAAKLSTVKFQFDRYDITDDMQRHQLFEIQLKNGIKTKNEIREELGLEPMENGDELGAVNPFAQGMFGNPKTDEEREENHKKKFGNSKLPPKGTGRKDEKEKQAEKESEEKAKKKALTTSNPLILKPNEQMTPNRVVRGLDYLINQTKKEIYQAIDIAAGKNSPKLKAIDPLTMKTIANLFSLGTLKGLFSKAILRGFDISVQETEQKFNRNIFISTEASGYIEEHSLENMKDAEVEIKNDIRAELQRGYMAGEGVDKLKARVDKVLDKGKTRAEAVVRTEINRAENIGHLESYKALGVGGKKRWVSAMDSRTSDLCRHLNGKEVGLNENFKYGNFEGPIPPAHVMCRSRIIFVGDDK